MQHTEGPRSLFSTEDRYRLLVDAVTDHAIYMLDPDGVVASWNAGAERLKGYTQQEIVGRHFSQFYPAEDVAAGVPARALATAARDGRFSSEGWRVRKGGERFWAHVVIEPIVAADGALLGFAKVTRDLSERREAEQSLQRSEQQFRLLVQSVTDYAIYMLDPNGIVTNWNAGAQRIKGYASEEVIGTHFSRFYRDDERERGEPVRALQVAGRDGRYEAEGWRVRKDGSLFWANVVIDPVRDAAGTLLGFAKVTRDVTEKRNNQLALERTREALFQSQKMDAIGRLTGGVAHDFNNLLMVVLSSLELLRRRIPDDERTQRLIDNAVQGARRGATLTQRMLAFARRQDLKPVAVDVASLVHGMRDMLAHSLGPSIAIVTEFAGEPFPVLVDPNQLELAVLNLAVNARDAMPRGGTLTIGAAFEEIAAATADLGAGAFVRLQISDTGTGMDEATLAHATEPFFTTKGTGKGTGLGLPMVHGLAAQSGGLFKLDSVAGRGTTAQLWLPVAPAASLPGEATATPPLAADASPLLVVAVDDDALVLAGTVSLLEDLGHSVLAANSAAQGLELMRRHPDVALLVTDQAMPGMTGAQLIERVRRERPGLPMILATGFGEYPSPASDSALRLAKPFGQAELASAIRTALSDAASVP